MWLARGSGETTSRNCEQRQDKQRFFPVVQGFGFYTEQNGDPLEGWIRLTDTYCLKKKKITLTTSGKNRFKGCDGRSGGAVERLWH